MPTSTAREAGRRRRDRAGDVAMRRRYKRVPKREPAEDKAGRAEDTTDAVAATPPPPNREQTAPLETV